MDLKKNNEIEILIDNLSPGFSFRLNTHYLELVQRKNIIYFLDIKGLYREKDNSFVIRKFAYQEDDKATLYKLRYTNYYSMVEDYINLAEVICEYKEKKESFLTDYDFRE